MKLFAIYDVKSNSYSPLKMAPSTANAIRQFTSLVNAKDTDESQYPNDFMLYELGSFDEQTGKFEILSEPQNLGLASNFKSESLH